jgi:lipopolysaccharide/colanic/teichoic acid biosynthesis glycosyltransferase
LTTVVSEYYPAGVPAPRAARGADSNSRRALDWYPACKGVLDRLLSIALFVAALPVMLVAIALTKLTSAGPAIYSQTRVGLGGRLFTIYKIRTMVLDSEARTGARWCVPRDPRVTPFGRFLRWSHIDELPQLINVLKGEMSLIGPRPERPEFVAQLERAIPLYRDRLQVRPGVTGLAQVQLPPDVDLEGVRRKQACDLYYVYRHGPWLDLRILIGTASGILGIPFAVPRTLLAIPSGRAIEDFYLSLATGSGPEAEAEIEVVAAPSARAERRAVLADTGSC